MQITKPTSGYNARRYGKPWIATVDFSGGAAGEYHFGEWCGQAGEAGELYITAEPGDIIADGQKDFRKPRNSAPAYYLVLPNGSLESCSKSEAYRHWQAKQQQPANGLRQSALESVRNLIQEFGITADEVFPGVAAE